MERAREVLEVEAARKKGLSGKNVGIAIMDTGINPYHPDFRGRIVAFSDFVNKRIQCYDDNGHGTHVAGIAAGTGEASMGQYEGMAPESQLVIAKILDKDGNGNVGNVLRAIDWIIYNKEYYGIRVVNISIGADSIFEEESVLVRGVDKMWDSGLVVCVAAGNRGPDRSSIGAPGNSRKVITVGAEDDGGEFIIHGKRVRNYSGRGPTKNCIKKPDVVALGSRIVSCSGKGGGMGFRQYYEEKSGTSMAAPMVAGGISLLLESEPKLTNKEVKMRIRDSAIDLGKSHSEQGWGRLNMRTLLKG